MIYYKQEASHRIDPSCYIWQRGSVFDQVSKLRTHYVFENIKMNTTWRLYTLNLPQSFQGIQKNSARIASVIRWIFNKIANIFTRFRLFQLYFLKQIYIYIYVIVFVLIKKAPFKFSRGIICLVQGYSVLYVKRVTAFKKWYKISWRKCLEVTSTLSQFACNGRMRRAQIHHFWETNYCDKI